MFLRTVALAVGLALAVIGAERGCSVAISSRYCTFWC